jgi:hypothetical protein
MISRRDCLASGATAAFLAPATGLAAASAALPVPPSGQLGFRLLRNGERIGSHTLVFTPKADILTVTVAIDILVKLGPIPVYRYRHRATERWQDGSFIGIESQTDKDGTALRMRAERTGDGMVVEGSQTARYIAPPQTYPTTYWNKVMLQDRLINSEDGRLFTVTPRPLGEEDVRQAGNAIRARHYRIDGDLMLDLWYDTMGQWAHLVFIKDGATIVYEKL